MIRQAGELLAPFLPTFDVATSPASASLVRYSRRAMATEFEIVMPFGTRGGNAAADQTFELIDLLESRLSVFRDDSIISVLNRTAAAGPVIVEPDVFSLLQTAESIHFGTWGAFDITAGPLIRVWGYLHRKGRMPTALERAAAMQSVGMRHVELNRDNCSVRYLRDGVEINLGSIGKGYALDRAAEQLRANGIRDFLVHAGGSSVYAAGNQPGCNRGWPVRLRHPWKDDVGIGTVYLRDRALGTSAATFQYFEYNKRRLGHVIDPRTGRPAEGIASASATAATAAAADAYATALYVLGLEKTRIVCQMNSGLSAVILPEEADVPTVFADWNSREFDHANIAAGDGGESR